MHLAKLQYENSFLQLEERLLLAAQPVVSIDGDAQPLIGEQTRITVTFDNVPDASRAVMSATRPMST